MKLLLENWRKYLNEEVAGPSAVYKKVSAEAEAAALKKGADKLEAKLAGHNAGMDAFPGAVDARIKHLHDKYKKLCADPAYGKSGPGAAAMCKQIATHEVEMKAQKDANDNRAKAQKDANDDRAKGTAEQWLQQQKRMGWSDAEAAQKMVDYLSDPRFKDNPGPTVQLMQLFNKWTQKK
jgi:hypothetical protein